MKCYPSQPTLVPSGALRLAVAAVGDALSTGLLATAALWRDHLRRRRRIHAFDGAAQMNEHLLKDIGAPSWFMLRAAARIEAQHRAWFEMRI